MMINAKRKYVYLGYNKVAFYGSLNTYKRLVKAIGDREEFHLEEVARLTALLNATKVENRQLQDGVTSSTLSKYAVDFLSKPYLWLFKEKFKFNRWKSKGTPFNFSL